MSHPKKAPIPIGALFLHDESQRSYTIYDIVDTIKIGDVWSIEPFIIYHRITEKKCYGRIESDFRKKFTRVRS